MNRPQSEAKHRLGAEKICPKPGTIVTNLLRLLREITLWSHFLGGCVNVVRLCPRRAMRPHLGGRLTPVTVPAPSVRALDAGVAGAVTPGDDVQVAYPTPSTSHRQRSSGPYYGDDRALVSMITDSTVGRDIAKWVRVTATRLGVIEVIYRRTSGLRRGRRAGVRSRYGLVEIPKQGLHHCFVTRGGFI